MRSSLFPARATVPFSFGIGAVFTLIHMEMFLAALVVFIVAAGIALVALPRDAWSPGLDMKTTADTDFTRRDHLRLLVPGALAFIPGTWVGGAGWPLYFLGVSGLMMLSFRAANRRTAAMGRRRAQKVLESTSLADATLPRLTTADEHRDVIRALADMGAVDGIRARTWLLAKELGRDVGKLRAEVGDLERDGLVSVSTVDAGADISRHLVELTPVGVRVLTELSRR
ncbi:hypothetical protein [Corynebacterium sp.]|uniref:hypothetical protein n=1 Tax=Corynebacterium sp. TaxID=1720 RepID=UPI00198678D4|nr:hypothetical protein [Corynebacterium sp.]HHU67914.1 hypothetical protein [Corynebacterium sp.]